MDGIDALGLGLVIGLAVLVYDHCTRKKKVEPEEECEPGEEWKNLPRRANDVHKRVVKSGLAWGAQALWRMLKK